MSGRLLYILFICLPKWLTEDFTLAFLRISQQWGKKKGNIGLDVWFRHKSAEFWQLLLFHNCVSFCVWLNSPADLRQAAKFTLGVHLNSEHATNAENAQKHYLCPSWLELYDPTFLSFSLALFEADYVQLIDGAAWNSTMETTRWRRDTSLATRMRVKEWFAVKIAKKRFSFTSFSLSGACCPVRQMCAGNKRRGARTPYVFFDLINLTDVIHPCLFTAMH